jgi:signal transduction histidine kinase
VIEVQRAAMAEVDRTGRAEGYHYPLSLPGGERWFDVCAAAIENPDGDSTGSASHGYVFVIRDITQRKRDERLKHEFISVVSHELRTPLTSIRGALAALSSGVLTNQPERSQEMLTIAQRNERHLAALIDDLLDMDKLLAGTMELNLQPQHLPKLLGSATEASIRAVNAAGLELKIAKPVPELRVLVDTARFTQILDNLVSNAIKASAHSERSEIVLSARRVADRVQLSVRDHGPGVAESLVPKLYEPFTVLDGSTTRASGGTGMGLAIVRRLLDRMGGSINYADADGGGAVFTIELPLYTDPESTS